MCGISGQINFESERPVDEGRMERMTRALNHRGPDGEGVWVKGPVGLGHARLAVIDLSPNGRQPMTNEDGTVWITFNGEIYNFQDLRSELESKGHRFRSKTDTEAIIHLYEEEGLECVARLRGMFAFALWDDKKKRLLLARDRLGQKPLYYHSDHEKILFSSEVGGILASGLVEAVPDDAEIFQYLCLGYVPHPGTGLKEIRKLAPAHRMVVEEGRVRTEAYWSGQPARTDREPASEEETLRDLHERVMEATRIRMVSDVPLGALLSGGIDSGIIVAAMARTSSRIKTFTVGFDHDLFDERAEARFLADRLGTDHHEMVVTPDVRELLPKIAAAYGEPFGDPAAVPSYYVARMARQHVTVVLNGDGGDESFAGYGEYIQGQTAGWAARVPGPVGRAFAGLLDQKRPGKAKSLAEVLALSGRSEARIIASLRLLLPLDRMRRLMKPAFGERLQGFDPISHLIERYREMNRGDSVNAMLAVDRDTFLPDDLLFKIDIATMRHGLEARSPFLDHPLVEYAAGLPGRMKLSRFRKKHILKKAFADLLPPEVLSRPKRGFDVPVGRWLRSDLKDAMREIITTQNFVTDRLDREKLERMFSDHVSGREDQGRFFWALLMLNEWSRTIKRERFVGTG